MNGKQIPHYLKAVHPDPKTNTVDIRELFHRGTRDAVIEQEMEAKATKELLMEISKRGYPMIRIARHGSHMNIRASTPDGRYIEAGSVDPEAKIAGALRTILDVLDGKRRP